MRTLGIDCGEKRIGVAVSDPLGITAQPVAVIEADKVFAELDRIMSEYSGIEEIVVGLPKTLKGEIGPAAQKVQAFIEELESRYRQKIVAWDERLTTAAAEKALIMAGVSRRDRKKVIDKTAAAYILQSYLDSKSR